MELNKLRMDLNMPRLDLTYEQPGTASYTGCSFYSSDLNRPTTDLNRRVLRII